jgi:hypothetical protein
MRLEKAQTSERFRPRSDVRSIFRIGGAAHLTSLDRQNDLNPAGRSGPDRAKAARNSREAARASTPFSLLASGKARPLAAAN